MNEKKAIEELEEFIKGPCETCKYCEAAYKLNRKNIIQLLNLTKKLQKENEYLQYKLREKISVEAHEQVKQNYISKNIIKDKLRKNDEIIEDSNDGDLIYELCKENKVLQKLLEKEQ